MLNRYPIAGCFKRHPLEEFAHRPTAAAWEYHGGMYWFRAADFFRRNWRAIEQNWTGTETAPGILYRPEEGGRIFPERQIGLKKAMYHESDMKKAEMEFAEFSRPRPEPQPVQAATPTTGFAPIRVRHLCYVILPVSRNGIWQRNLDQLIPHLPLFNGRKRIAILTGSAGRLFSFRGCPIMAKNSIGNLSVIISASTSGLSAALKRSQSIVSGFAASVNRAASAASASLSAIGKGVNFANPLSGLIPSFEGLKTAGVAALGGLSVYSVKLAADAEQTSAAFETMLGSASEANRMVSDIKRIASETPFASKELLDASRQLLAYGTAADQIVPSLRLIGDISSGVSQPHGDLVYLYCTLQTQGRAYTKDIQQFAGRGIGVYEELAKVLKVDREEVGKLVEEGKVGFREGGRFSSAMAKQSQTLAGLFESLKDNAVLTLEEIGKVLIEEFDLKGLTRQATEWTKDLKNRVNELRPLFREVADWSKAIGNALSVGFRSAWIAAEGFVTGINAAFDLTTKAMNLKDYLKGLTFDFKAARDVGVNFAEGVATGIGSLMDSIEEAVHGVKRLYVGQLEPDAKQFAIKTKLEGNGPAEEAKKQAEAIQQYFAEAQRRQEFIARTGAVMPREERTKHRIAANLLDFVNVDDAVMREKLAEKVQIADAGAANKIRAISKEMAIYQERIVSLTKALEDPKLKNNPTLTDQLKLDLTEVTKLQGQIASIQADVQRPLLKKAEKTMEMQLAGMDEEIRSVRLKRDAEPPRIGKNVEKIGRSFEGLRNLNAKSDLAKMLGQRVAFGDVAAKVLRFNVAFKFKNAWADMQRWFDSHTLKAPIQTASDEQREMARQLLANTKSPRESFKDEMKKLDQLIDVRAFSSSGLGANLLGGNLIDLRQQEGARVIGLEAARKFQELRESLGDRGPKLSGAFTKGSTQAASVEAQFAVAGSGKPDNQREIIAVLREGERKHERETTSLEAIARMLEKVAKNFGGVAPQ